MNRKSPKLRFRNFKDDWTSSKLGEIATITSGGTPSRNISNYWNGDIPWVSTSLIDFNVILRADEYITKDGVINSSAKLFPKGTILMAMYGQGKTRGKVAMLGIEATTNQACAAILTNDEISNKFIYQNLTGRYDELRDLSNEGGQQNLSGGIIKAIKVATPSLPEQQKIASFLSVVDEKIQQLRKKKQLQEQYKKGVMQQLFSGELRFKDKNGKTYPKWSEKSFDDLYEFYSTNSLSRDKLNYETGSVKNIHYGDIHTKFRSQFILNKENVPYINQDVDLSKVNDENYCKEGDLVIADASEDYNDIGKSIELVKLHNQKVVAGLHTFLARPDRNVIQTGYSGYLLQSPSIKIQIMKIAQGSKVLSISTSRLGKVRILLPHKSEQLKIANFLTALDAKIEAINTQITQTQTFKKGLLQQMFV